jgi:hypothetical protein
MPYWIHEDGETIGPMRAIDVLRRARPTTLVSDGKEWFHLEDDLDAHETAAAAGAPAKPERIVIRTAIG